MWHCCLSLDVQEGSTILLDDGLIELTVRGIRGGDIVCRVQNDGFISNNKGVNVPNVHLSMPFISERDREDIIFGIQNGFDFIAASFVRTAADVLEIRKIFDEFDCHGVNIIAKIENQEGVENIDQILRVSDGIMVARGDMGVEIPLGHKKPHVPAQKTAHRCEKNRGGALFFVSSQKSD